jgi:hypothetical protein
VFYLVRLCKAHPQLAGKRPDKVIHEIEKLLNRSPRPRQATSGDLWHHWLGVFKDDAEATFYDTWDRVRWLPGQYDPLENAAELSRQQPLGLDAETRAKRPAGYVQFVSLAAWLQTSMPDRPIMLPCREVAAILGVSPITVSRYRKWAVEDGFLQEVRESEFRGKGKSGIATEFRFAVGCWPYLRERLGMDKESNKG